MKTKTKSKKITKKKIISRKKNNLPAIKKQNNKLQVNLVTEKTIDDFLFGSNTKLTDQQKVLFKKTAVMFNLNPFKSEIYAVPFGNRMSIITGYEVYLKKANQLKLLDGWSVDCEGQGNDMRAIVIIHRKDWKETFKHEVYLREYDQGNSMWQKKPITMIKKVAMAQAFRLCFTEEFDGMPYTTDEMPLKDNDYSINEITNNNSESKVTEIEQTKEEATEEFSKLYSKVAKGKNAGQGLQEFMAQIQTMTIEEIQGGTQRLKQAIMETKMNKHLKKVKK